MRTAHRDRSRCLARQCTHPCSHVAAVTGPGRSGTLYSSVTRGCLTECSLLWSAPYRHIARRLCGSRPQACDPIRRERVLLNRRLEAVVAPLAQRFQGKVIIEETQNLDRGEDRPF